MNMCVSVCAFFVFVMSSRSRKPEQVKTTQVFLSSSQYKRSNREAKKREINMLGASVKSTRSSENHTNTVYFAPTKITQPKLIYITTAHIRRLCFVCFYFWSTAFVFGFGTTRDGERKQREKYFHQTPKILPCSRELFFLLLCVLFSL